MEKYSKEIKKITIFFAVEQATFYCSGVNILKTHEEEKDYYKIQNIYFDRIGNSNLNKEVS